MTDLEKYMTSMMKLMEQMKKRNGFKFSCIEEFVLKIGKSFEPAPSLQGLKRGRLRECFRNAYYETTRFAWGYAEGYAVGKGMFPVLHAWVVDPFERAVEVTWPEVGVEYFGVEIPIRYVESTMMKRKVFGVIDNWEGGFPLLRGTDDLEKW